MTRSVVASVAASGEFQELGDALNRMADKLDRTTAELRSERDRFGVVLEGMVEGVIGLTSDGRVALCNRSATAMFGEAAPPLGKRLLGIRIVRGDGSRATLGRLVVRRYLPVYLVQALPTIGIGASLLDQVFVFRASRRCLHDDIADTKVIKVPPIPKGPGA